MKKLLRIVSLSLLCITGSCHLGQAQTLTPIDTNAMKMPEFVASPQSQALSSVIRWDETAQAATNWIFALAPIYAPHLRDKDGTLQHYGVGVSALYPAGQFAYVGFSLDYIGRSLAVGNVGATIKADLKLFNHVRVTPLVETKVAYTLSDNGQLGTEPIGVVGAGFTSTIWHNEKNTMALGVLFVIEKWSNYDGPVYRPGITFNYSW